MRAALAFNGLSSQGSVKCPTWISTQSCGRIWVWRSIQVIKGHKRFLWWALEGYLEGVLLFLQNFYPVDTMCYLCFCIVLIQSQVWSIAQFERVFSQKLLFLNKCPGLKVLAEQYSESCGSINGGVFWKRGDGQKVLNMPLLLCLYFAVVSS